MNRVRIDLYKFYWDFTATAPIWEMVDKYRTMSIAGQYRGISFYGRIWAPPLGFLIVIWSLLVAIPLGVALTLAAITVTPAALVARMRGRSASEHYCPGGIDFVDHWGTNLGKK